MNNTHNTDLYAQIEALYASGLGYKAVADALGIGRSRVEKYIRKRGLSKSERKAPLAQEWQIEEIESLGRQGMGARYCARKTGLSVATCYAQLCKMGFGKAKPKNGQAIGHWGTSEIKEFGSLEAEHGRWWALAYKPKRASTHWYYRNHEAAKKRGAESAKARYYRIRHAPEYKAKQSARNAVSRIIRYTRGEWKKSVRTQELLGCTYAECVRHIERQFKRGMRWSNHGTIWEIDHIIPLCDWDLTDPAQLKRACNYLNLRPLHKSLNRPGLNAAAPDHSQMALAI